MLSPSRTMRPVHRSPLLRSRSRNSLSLAEDTAEAVDFVDAHGAIVSDEDEGNGAVFTRRWRITPLDAFVPDAIVIEVCVFHSPADGLGPVASEACLATVRARQP